MSEVKTARDGASKVGSVVNRAKAPFDFKAMPSDEYKVHKPGGLKLKGGDMFVPSSLSSPSPPPKHPRTHTLLSLFLCAQQEEEEEEQLVQEGQGHGRLGGRSEREREGQRKGGESRRGGKLVRRGRRQDGCSEAVRGGTAQASTSLPLPPCHFRPAELISFSPLQLLDKANRAAVKSHKERVAEFNEKLENLSEHYDIPKVRFPSLCHLFFRLLTLLPLTGRTRLNPHPVLVLLRHVSHLQRISVLPLDPVLQGNSSMRFQLNQQQLPASPLPAPAP